VRKLAGTMPWLIVVIAALGCGAASHASDSADSPIAEGKTEETAIDAGVAGGQSPGPQTSPASFAPASRDASIAMTDVDSAAGEESDARQSDPAVQPAAVDAGTDRGVDASAPEDAGLPDALVAIDPGWFADEGAEMRCVGGVVDDHCRRYGHCYKVSLHVFCNLPDDYPCDIGVQVQGDCHPEWRCHEEGDELCGYPRSWSDEECEAAGAFVVFDPGDGSGRCPTTAEYIREVHGSIEGAYCCFGPRLDCSVHEEPEVCTATEPLLLTCNGALPSTITPCRELGGEGYRYCCEPVPGLEPDEW